MKKITLLLVGLMASGMASAVQFSANGKLLMGECNLLNEDVSINLTTGVVAGVHCSPSRVAVAACHTAGMVKSRTVGTKEETTEDEDGEEVTTTVSCTISDADPDCEASNVTGASVANATTLRGTVSTGYPSGVCASAAVPEAFAAGLP